MRVLILGSKEYPLGTSDDPIKSGGIEVYTENFVKYLKKNVEKIIIITRKFKKTEKLEVHDNITIYRVPWIRGFYFRNPSFNFMAFLRAIFLDFDVMLCQGPVATLLGFLIKKIKNKPLISRPAGIAYVQPQYNRIVKKVLYAIEKIAYLNADFVVFLSKNEMKEFKKKMNFLPKNFVIIHTGVEVCKNFGKKKKDVAFVGRLVKVKGADILIRAACELGEDIEVLIIGDGPDRKYLESISCKLVKFLGWRSDVHKILRDVEIFVLPSFSEGMPVSLLEAMACRCACIVSDIGLPFEKEVLKFKTGDYKDLKRILKKILKEPKIRKRLSYYGYKRVKNDFSWEKAVKKYMEIFHCLAQRV